MCNAELGDCYLYPTQTNVNFGVIKQPQTDLWVFMTKS